MLHLWRILSSPFRWLAGPWVGADPAERATDAWSARQPATRLPVEGYAHGDPSYLEVWRVRTCTGRPALVGHAVDAEDAWWLAGQAGLGHYEARTQVDGEVVWRIEVVATHRDQPARAGQRMSVAEAARLAAAPWN